MSVCDWLRQTLSPKRGRATRKAVDLTHTSFWSESSDISLVSLDKDPQCWEEGKYASRSAAAPGVAQKVNACTFATIHWRTTPSHMTHHKWAAAHFYNYKRGERERKPHYQKLCCQVICVWDNCRCHPNRCAMERTQPKGTTLLIMVNLPAR